MAQRQRGPCPHGVDWPVNPTRLQGEGQYTEGMLFDSPSTFGRSFRILSFGESHGPAVGVVLDGVKPGLPFDLEAIQKEMDRRRPGQSDLVTPRSEGDRVQVLSGVFEGKTTGHPIALVVFNENGGSFLTVEESK